MSRHKECGETITWVKNPSGSGRWLPPLEYAGHAYVVTVNDEGEQVGQQMPVYKVHECDPDKVIAWTEYQIRLAELKERQPDGWDDYRKNVNETSARRKQIDEERDMAWEYALKRKCPNEKCAAKRGEKCVNLHSVRRGGEIAYVKNPHPARLALTNFERDLAAKREKDKELHL